MVTDPIFEIALDDASTITKILQELNLLDDKALLMVNNDGMRLILNSEKSFQISAFFAASTFNKFIYNSEQHGQVNFRFLLNEFIECLYLLRDDQVDDRENRLYQMDDHSRSGDTTKTSLELRYKSKGDVLRLKLANNSNCEVECGIKAFNLPDLSTVSPMTFNIGEDTASIGFDSKKLYDYISGIDLTSSDLVNLHLQQGRVPVKICTRSILLGEVELEICDQDSEIIVRELTVSSGCQFAFNYRTKFMKLALEALKTSIYMKLKCSSGGLLCTEHFYGMRDLLKPNLADLMGADSMEYMTDKNTPPERKSSVEYFITAEAHPIE